MPNSIRLAVGFTLIGLATFTHPIVSQGQNAIAKNAFPRMIAEFEPQRAIMLSVSDLQKHHFQILKQIVEASRNHAQILILYNHDQQLKATVELLDSQPQNQPKHVSFYQLELDTVWLRDFGPRISEDSSGARVLDFYYYGVRPFDDSFPERWALQSRGSLTKIPWTIQGGNLIANGQGIGITTTKIFEDNQVALPGRSVVQSRQFLINEMQKLCNLKKLIILEPLRNETTKHVDMFATFVAPDHVLIAQLDPQIDRANAKILDDNARKMANIKIGGKSMRVSRIRIPNRDETAWSTYTNAIMTDRLVLVPTTKSDPEQLKREAIATYRRLLPRHRVAPIDISSMKKLQGSLHCLTLNLPALAPLPSGIIPFDEAVKIAKSMPQTSKIQTTSDLSKRYTIDKQLRRIFKSSTSDYLLDAYAVALEGDIVSLLRAADRKLIRIRTIAVCEADRYWIQRNANKIQQNGAAVRRHVLSLGD